MVVLRAPGCQRAPHPQIRIKGLQTYPAENNSAFSQASRQKPDPRPSVSSPPYLPLFTALHSFPPVPLPPSRSVTSPTDQSPGMGLGLLEASVNHREPDGGPGIGRARGIFWDEPRRQSHCLAGFLLSLPPSSPRATA